MIHASFLKLSKPCSGPRVTLSILSGPKMVPRAYQGPARHPRPLGWTSERASQLHQSTRSKFSGRTATVPFISDLDAPPSLHEVTQAVKGLKNNKTPGPDGIPAEIFKYGGQYLLHRLHRFILLTWKSKQLPQQWKDANIVTIFKRKGDQAVCGNSRGISLLSVTGKILARVMLQPLLTHVVDIVMPESQCGFRRNRSTIDMVFVARLLQEKCHEQHSSLYLAFIDLTKAFDTVNRTLLWGILSKFGCTPQFLGSILTKDCDLTSEKKTIVSNCQPLPLGDSPSACSSTTISQSTPKSLFTMPSVFLSSCMDVRAGHSIAAM